MGDSAIGTHDAADTGWRFTATKDAKLGFYLEDLSHDGHAFADSIRLERVAVAGFSDADAKRPRQDSDILVFGLGECTEVAPPTLESWKSTDPMGFYAPRSKVAGKYQLKDVFGETDQRIDFDFSFLFTPYNKDVSHEPGGAIPAARLYPTFTFDIPGVSHAERRTNYRRPTAVQALFRINMRFDDNENVGNQIGLFTDLEDMGIVGGVMSMAVVGKRGSVTFLAAEKPLPYEIVGRGVVRGGIGGWDNRNQGWDNIHQWSHPTMPGFDSPEKGLEQQPFTPGLPYGGHMHWRWGAEAASGALGLTGSGKQFAGPQGPGTPLIDDRIRDQNIEFAVIDGTDGGWFHGSRDSFYSMIDDQPAKYLFTDFSDLFTDLVSEPGILLPSSNLVIWLSITAWGPGWGLSDLGYREFYPGSGVSPDDFPDVEHGVRYVLPSWGGTMFPQGMFFPHEDVSYLPSKIRAIPGGHKSQYLPDTPKRTWRR